MDEPRIRAASAADAPAISQIVEQAYRHYIARIGKPPGPMFDDYAARVADGVVWVIEEGSGIAGVLVLLPLCMDRLPFATESVLSEVADMYPACCSARGPWP